MTATDGGPVFGAVVGDSNFACPTLRTGALLEARTPAWRYEFADPKPPPTVPGMPAASAPRLAGFLLAGGVEMSEEVLGEGLPFPPGVRREGAVARLAALDGRGELTVDHVRLLAASLGVAMRTVWRWVAAARREGRLSARAPARVSVTADLRTRLAVWGGNVAAVHRELVAEAAAGGDLTRIRR